jgi:hypothetical protein
VSPEVTRNELAAELADDPEIVLPGRQRLIREWEVLGYLPVRSNALAARFREHLPHDFGCFLRKLVRAGVCA